MFFVYFLLGCFDDSITEKNGIVSKVEPAEKQKSNFRINRVEEYHISHIYDELPQFVFAANEGINVRNRASANSSVLSKLPLGTRIEILSKDKEETLGSRTDNWYQVRVRRKGKEIEGYLFGSTLTPYSLRADWDGDGKNERMFVMFNERKELLIRLADPNGEDSWSNLSAYTKDDFTADSLTVKLLHKEVAGLPLLKIEANDALMSTFWTKFVSYHHGKVLRALEYVETETNEQYFKIEPMFGPKKLSVKEIEGVVQADGSQKQTIVTKRYRYRSGVFVEKHTSEPVQKVLPAQTTN